MKNFHQVLITKRVIKLNQELKEQVTTLLFSGIPKWVGNLLNLMISF